VSWVALSFDIDAACADALSDALLERGALSVEVTDADAGTPGEIPLFREPGEPDQSVWPHSRITALFDAGREHARALAAACESAGVMTPQAVRTEAVSDQDWVRATQQQFGPIEVSPRFWIVPSWCEPPFPDALILRLDPGLAFGTGSHPTTSQCLRWLEQHLQPGESVLDYGCGSGILAIAARRLGAARVTGTDIDPHALEASRRNATENDVLVEFVPPDGLSAEPFDVVVANILANPLRVLAPLLAALTRSGGRLVLAGVLDGQAATVSAAYSPWFDLVASNQREGWTCLTGSRKLVA
jgi:ribosomal protein L11 methyltransferase